MSTKQGPSITRQLQVVFAISIVILIGCAYASYYTNNKLIESSKWVNHTNEVLYTTESMFASVKEAESGQRGYILTNEPIFLQRYNGGYERTLKIYDRVKQLTADNNEQQENIARIRPLIDDRFKQMQDVLDMVSKVAPERRAELLQTTHDELLKGKVIMDQLRGLIDRMKSEETDRLKQRLGQQDLYTTYTPVMVIIASLLSILITVLAYFRIKKDIDIRVARQKEDEARYFETNKRIGEMERVAHKIAEGDYSARSHDKQKDELGRISTALNEMVAALEKNFAEMERHTWQQAGSVSIGNAVRGERIVRNMAGKVITAVAEHINAGVASLYVADRNMHLRLSGSYAGTHMPPELKPGEGLTGQAIQSGKMLVSDALPPGYLKIASSIGSIQSVYAIIVPLLYGDTVVGALEVGLLRKPEERDLAFLENNAESLAVAINSALNYERTQELLEQTQAQAEELQVQHSELEGINAELEIQTEKLQASEEELRVQQEELQQANQELEERSRMLEDRNHMIVEKNMEVQRKAEELAQSTKYKSEFLANMSHELRTPLNSILLLSRLLAENITSNLNEEQVEYARVIQTSGNGLLSLIDEILDLSKIEAGKMTIEYEDVRIPGITEDLRALFEPMAKEKKIEFHINIGDNVPLTLETDKQRLEQVLKNLLSNAMKFTTKGSITLSININAKNKDRIDFSVADTGIGIPDEKQALIFEAFQQADGSTRRKYGGTGLGLSISKELAKLLGGTLTLVSKADAGSTFTLTVPVTQQYRIREFEPHPVWESVRDTAPAPEVVTPQDNGNAGEDYNGNVSGNGRSEKYIAPTIPEAIPDDRAILAKDDKAILIVEDDTGFAKALLDFTRKKGYKGIVSVRGDEGVELARQYKPMGILLDLQLPVKSGWQVMEELKSTPSTRHIPVHMMSSHSVKKESIKKGAVDFINKPVAFEQMPEIFNKLEGVINKTTKKVLIVEENPQHAKALAYYLESFDVNADIKNNVAESIAALKDNTDCVILDMGVPDSKSYAMLEEIKKDPQLENLPIIVFTGKSLSMAEELRIKQYADSIVVKTAHSYQRILDEVSLFLHMMEEGSGEKKDAYKKLGALNDVLKGKTVLVVDDDVRNIFSLTRALEHAGMSIVTAIDGKEAMDKLQENNNIDIVLLDMMMPLMDGYETATAIRQHKEWKTLPVIAVTAKAMSGDREKCIQAGASDYITKPVDVDQLLSLLRVWLYGSN